MIFGMFSAIREDVKIQKSIVFNVFIDMMYDLNLLKWSANKLLHDVAMQKNQLSILIETRIKMAIKCWVLRGIDGLSFQIGRAHV